MVRSSSSYAVHNFLREHMVPINDCTDQCMLAAVSTWVAILRGRIAGLSFWKAASQGLFDYRVEKGYQKSIRTFRELGVLHRGLPGAPLSLDHPRQAGDGGASQKRVYNFYFSWPSRVHSDSRTAGVRPSYTFRWWLEARGLR